ncbi:hypothetical protein FACS1894123_00920 [Bacteroidia bacterium]|nr:hypothetical protein FACS1894123_00920 [Bacteroidia bacterium]
MSYADLKELDELRRSGAITEEEYQREKQKVLDKGNNQSGKPLLGLEENPYLALMHVSQFSGYIIPGLGFIVPVILWALNKDYNARVDSTGKGIINFMLTWLVFVIIAGILCFLLIGIPILIALGIIQVVFIIIATIKAANGEDWKYPFTIQILK